MTSPTYNHMKPLRDAIEAAGYDYYRHAYDHLLDTVAEYEYGKIYFTGERFKFLYSDVHPATITLRQMYSFFGTHNKPFMDSHNLVVIPVGTLGKR